MWYFYKLHLGLDLYLHEILEVSLGIRVTRFFSGQVIQNSGNENCYPILVPKKHYPQFRVPDNLGLGSGIPDLPKFSKNNTLHKISIAIYI